MGGAALFALQRSGKGDCHTGPRLQWTPSNTQEAGGAAPARQSDGAGLKEIQILGNLNKEMKEWCSLSATSVARPFTTSPDSAQHVTELRERRPSRLKMEPQRWEGLRRGCWLAVLPSEDPSSAPSRTKRRLFFVKDFLPLSVTERERLRWMALICERQHPNHGDHARMSPADAPPRYCLRQTHRSPPAPGRNLG